MSNLRTVTAEQLLTAYEEFGYKLVKVDRELKKPNYAKWQLKTIPSDEIRRWVASGGNIGIQVGEVSNWLCAVDLDCPEAQNLAPQFLPDTLKSGKQGNASHWWYQSAGAGFAQFSDTDQEVLIDLKASANGAGHQVVVAPSVHPAKGPYEWIDGFNPSRIAEIPAKELTARVRRLALAVLIERHRPKVSGGHLYAMALVGFLLRNDMNFEILSSILEKVWPPDKYAHDNIPGVLRNTARKLANNEAVQGGRTLERLAPGLPRVIAHCLGWQKTDDREGRRSYRCTDTGNAERFADRHGGDLRYCFPLKAWFVYDGKRWRKDDTGHVVRLAKETARSVFEEAANAGDDERAKELGKWAIASQSATRIQAMLELGKSEPGIPIRPDELDANAYLFNCSNGTIDLRSDTLREHRREDLITKLAPVAYKPSARSDLFERVLREATSDNAELASFLRRWAGYCLTGDTSEEKLAFSHGDAATGKSTILEALKATWGDYAATADFEAFLSRQHTGGPRNDIARLAGTRLVVSIEVDEGKKLAEGLIKMLTGGDTVTARFLYQEAFEFAPTFKLTLAANHAPQVRNDDEAIWRRILRVPFDNVIPKSERDPSIKKVLKDTEASGPAILAWAVKGCLEWQQEGLGVPPTVERATEAYREEMDPLRDFTTDYCILDPTRKLWAAAGQLREAYEKWAKETGEPNILRGRQWGERLRAHGCEPDQGAKGLRIWKGIALRQGGSDGDDTPPDPPPGRVVADSATTQNPSKPAEKSAEVADSGVGSYNFGLDIAHEENFLENPQQSATPHPPEPRRLTEDEAREVQCLMHEGMSAKEARRAVVGEGGSE
jgi:P4 family phage/plasmid primase-like protien